MNANLKIEQEDLKVLFVHTKDAYPNMSFENWCKDCEKSYMLYFNNKEIYNKKRYTYSQWVNSQILLL
jgi:hypothetical protein